MERTLSLSAEDSARCEQVGLRLRSGLSGLLLALEPHATSVRALADYLGINRNLCQRVAAAAKAGGDARGALVRAPGVRGLRIFVEAFRARGGSSELAHPADLAIDAFEAVIRDLAGSQTKLNARLEQAQRNVREPIPPAEAEAARRARFAADIQLMGISAGGLSVLDIYQPLPLDPAAPDAPKFETAQAFAWSQVRSHHRGVPFISGVTVDPGDGSTIRPMTLDHEALEVHSPGFQLDDFSSGRQPNYSQKRTPRASVGIFDLDLEPGGEAVDLASGRLLSPAGILPALTDAPQITRRVTARYPTERLIIDVYLHRSLAAACRASLGAYIPTATGLALHERWFDRLPNAPELQVIDPRTEPLDAPLWSRQADFARHVFARLDWSLDEFLCYRCEVTHPLIGVTYILDFDFRPSLTAEES